MLNHRELVSGLQLCNGWAMGHWCQYNPSATASIGKGLREHKLQVGMLERSQGEAKGAQPTALYIPGMRAQDEENTACTQGAPV